MNQQTPSSDLLRDRGAVVTGASSGLARAIAIELARAGADVWVHCLSNVAAAEETAAAIAALGRRAEVSSGDLADAAECQRLCQRSWQWRDSGVHIWVNNAGADVLTGPAADEPFEAKLQQLWQVDVLGAIRLSRDMGMRMKRAATEDHPRTILNIGWDQAEHGMEGDSGEMFAAVKGAVMAFTRSLAKSLAPQVRVNCLAPGWIQTAWGSQASETWQERARRESLLGRWGTPQDVAAAAVFLASEQAKFLTGVTLPVNGGFRHGTPP